MNDDDLINQVYRKIEREKVIINAANAMRQSSNPQVQQSLDSQVREARKGIGYLEERMRELQMRRMGQGGRASASSGGNEGLRPSSYEGMSAQQRALINSQSTGPPTPPPKDPRTGAYITDSGEWGDPGPEGYMGQDNLSGGHGMMPPRAPFGPSAPGSATPKTRRDYTNLGRHLL